MKTSILALVSVLLTVASSTDVIPTFRVGPCPEKCGSRLENTFKECASLEPFGCTLQPCGKEHEDRYVCTISSRLPLHPFQVQPGDKVVFDGLAIDRKTTFSNSFDLSSSALPSPAVGKTDIYFLLDATFSITSKLFRIRREINLIISGSDVFENVAFGIGIFRDELDPNSGFTNLVEITSRTGMVRKALRNVKAIGGGDSSEANLVALYKVATEESIGWRTGSRRIVVMFADTSGHEPTCVDGLRLTRTNVTSALRKEDISVIAVGPRKNLDAVPMRFRCADSTRAPAKQTSNITSETGGLLLEPKNFVGVATKVIESLSVKPTMLDVDTSDCDDKADISFSVTFPFTLVDSAAFLINQTLSLKKSACESREFGCKIKYSTGKTVLPPVAFEFKNPRGCPVKYHY